MPEGMAKTLIKSVNHSLPPQSLLRRQNILLFLSESTARGSDTPDCSKNPAEVKKFSPGGKFVCAISLLLSKCVAFLYKLV
jgi:hypothetical protein